MAFAQTPTVQSRGNAETGSAENFAAIPAAIDAGVEYCP
jgi:hypothetical protein